MKEIRMCVETDIELHTITSILTDSLREKEMFYADDNRRFADNMLLFIYIKTGELAMKKRVLCMILTLVMIFALVPSATAASNEATKAAEALYELGLFKGTGTNPDGTPIFDLDKTPTRNQAIIMLVRLLGKEEDALAGTWEIPFTDVSDAMRPYIGYAYANGLTNGYTATTYCGTNPIKSNQYITFVLRALGYASGEDFKVSTAWEFSDKIGLTDGRYHAGNTTFLRSDTAIISRGAIDTKQKDSEETLAEKLIENQVFTKEAYEKATTVPEVLKEPPAPAGPDVTFAVDGVMLPDWDWDYQTGAGSYIVTPYWDGSTFTDFEVEVENGKGSVKKNGDGTFTVNFPAEENLDITLWYNFIAHTEIDENGEENTEISRTKRSLTFATPVPDSGFALSRKGMTHLPGRGFGDNFSPYFVLDVYYNGKRIDNYTVTAAANAPFTASVQADGTLLLLKTGRGHAQFTISYQGQSADFGLFVS